MKSKSQVPQLPDYSFTSDLIAELLGDKKDDTMTVLAAVFAGFRDEADAMQAKFSKSTRDYVAGMTALMASAAKQRNALIASIEGIQMGTDAASGQESSTQDSGFGFTSSPLGAASGMMGALSGGSTGFGFTSSREPASEATSPLNTLFDPPARAIVNGGGRAPASVESDDFRPHTPRRDGILGPPTDGPSTHTR